MNEWVLVPAEQHEAQYDAISNSDRMWREQTSASIYAMHIASRPPIPRAVWDAMVERGARAIYEIGRSGAMSEWPARTAQYKTTFLSDAETALRAALGNPVVEGDAS